MYIPLACLGVNLLVNSEKGEGKQRFGFPKHVGQTEYTMATIWKDRHHRSQTNIFSYLHLPLVGTQFPLIHPRFTSARCFTHTSAKRGEDDKHVAI